MSCLVFSNAVYCLELKLKEAAFEKKKAQQSREKVSLTLPSLADALWFSCLSWLVVSHLILSYLILSHLISSHLILSHLISSDLIGSYLT
jgi:hypothetical protein